MRFLFVAMGLTLMASAAIAEETPLAAALGGGLGLAGFLVGAGFGALIGSGTKSEQWEKVELP